MALINCPDCETQVSDAAATCPKCARPMSGPQRVKTSEDSALTRSRGCADLIIWPALIGVVVLLIAMTQCG